MPTTLAPTVMAQALAQLRARLELERDSAPIPVGEATELPESALVDFELLEILGAPPKPVRCMVEADLAFME